jgi:hypothetical protein
MARETNQNGQHGPLNPLETTGEPSEKQAAGRTPGARNLANLLAASRCPRRRGAQRQIERIPRALRQLQYTRGPSRPKAAMLEGVRTCTPCSCIAAARRTRGPCVAVNFPLPNPPLLFWDHRQGCARPPSLRRATQEPPKFLMFVKNVEMSVETTYKEEVKKNGCRPEIRNELVQFGYRRS